MKNKPNHIHNTDTYEVGLISILSDYLGYDWNNRHENKAFEPLDGDEAETLAAHLLNRLQLMNGNITQKEFDVREELGSKIFYNTPDIFSDSKDCNTLVKFKSELEDNDVQFGILHGDLVVCLCGCGGLLEYGDYKILERLEKINISALLFEHFKNLGEIMLNIIGNKEGHCPLCDDENLNYSFAQHVDGTLKKLPYVCLWCGANGTAVYDAADNFVTHENICNKFGDYIKINRSENT